MDFNEYQVSAQRTSRNDLHYATKLALAGLGLTGEAGEVADIIKKTIGHGHELNINDLVKELGDVLWYVAEICELINIPMSSVAAKNITKLKKRYPEGFDEERSINRVE